MPAAAACRTGWPCMTRPSRWIASTCDGAADQRDVVIFREPGAIDTADRAGAEDDDPHRPLILFRLDRLHRIQRGGAAGREQSGRHRDHEQRHGDARRPSTDRAPSSRTGTSPACRWPANAAMTPTTVPTTAIRNVCDMTWREHLASRRAERHANADFARAPVTVYDITP